MPALMPAGAGDDVIATRQRNVARGGRLPAVLLSGGQVCDP